jgi:histidyl-tRNA synthetase
MNNIVKPSILPGFMELLPKEQIEFNKIRDIIKDTYEMYGFIPVDTPLIEKSEILLAKGGGETEKQIYRFTKGDTDMSLRFDLTVPLARYVALHAGELNFPFRRYHIGKVYRGERNQRGRFREFYQCDIDIIGNGELSIINDAEIPSIIYSIFKKLDFGPFTIRINNRKLLNGFFNQVTKSDKGAILRTIDKLEKIGETKVKEELKDIGVSDAEIDRILEFISIKGTNEEVLSSLKSLNIGNEEFNKGLEELSLVCHYIKGFNVPEENFEIDLTIARGLDYYTGTIYETTLDRFPEIGSVCSGGRYDNLAEYYTKAKLPGVGISIGLTRLFYQLSEAGLIKGGKSSTPSKVLIIPMGDVMDYSIDTAGRLRENNINCEIYFEEAKAKKKFSYGDKLGIEYVIIIGEEEKQNKTVSLKNLKTGDQENLSLDQVINKFV